MFHRLPPIRRARAAQNRKLSGESTPKAGPRLVAAGTSASVILGAAAPADVELPVAGDASPRCGHAAESGDRVGRAACGRAERLGRRRTSHSGGAIGTRQSGRSRGTNSSSDRRPPPPRLTCLWAPTPSVWPSPPRAACWDAPSSSKWFPAARSSRTRRRLALHANGGGRNRAEQDPIVRRIQEKFGAEIRTIIDYREKR